MTFLYPAVGRPRDTAAIVAVDGVGLVLPVLNSKAAPVVAACPALPASLRVSRNLDGCDADERSQPRIRGWNLNRQTPVDDTGLHIVWSNAQTERWTFTNYASITKLTLASHPTANRGWGWGSTAGFDSGLSAAQVFAAQTKLTGPFSQNNYGTVLESQTTLQLRPDASFPAALCSNSCINLSTPNTNKAFLGGTGADRRMYYNHEQYAVFSDDCVVKGHLKPALQVIDDLGAFRGLIMVEASLYGLVSGSDILGIYDLTNIT